MFVRSVTMFCVLSLVRVAAAQDLALSTVLMEGQPWERVSQGHKFTEGPAADADGNVYFSDIPASKIHRIDATGTVSLFAENTRETNGLMFGPDGRLYGCQNGARRIVTFGVDGQVDVVANEIESNDLVVLGNGTIYVTDPKGGRVWLITADRQKRIVAEGLRPNGVIAWSDQGTLVVTDAVEPTLWTFRINADGSLSGKDRYYGPLRMVAGDQRTGSDGMTVDSVGRLYVTTRAGLQMFDPIGRMSGVIHKPLADRPLSNVCFGGPERDYLYVTAGDSVFRRRTLAKGVAYSVTDKK